MCELLVLFLSFYVVLFSFFGALVALCKLLLSSLLLRQFHSGGVSTAVLLMSGSCPTAI
jgi:hypothetical protein